MSAVMRVAASVASPAATRSHSADMKRRAARHHYIGVTVPIRSSK
jgi:hypothetical protein